MRPQALANAARAAGVSGRVDPRARTNIGTAPALTAENTLALKR